MPTHQLAHPTPLHPSAAPLRDSHPARRATPASTPRYKSDAEQGVARQDLTNCSESGVFGAAQRNPGSLRAGDGARWGAPIASHLAIPAALSYARTLDALPVTDELCDALNEVGDLLGGGSIHGFAHDLNQHLQSLEDEFYAEIGPNDSRAWARLTIERELQHVAMTWLADARAAMARVGG